MTNLLKPTALADLDGSLLFQNQLGRRLLACQELGFQTADTFYINDQLLTALAHKNDAAVLSLLQFYHTTCGGSFVSIYYTAQKQPLSILNIIGDANLVDTLFELSQVCDPNSVLLQVAPDSSWGGIAWARNKQTNNKNQVEIWATSLVFPSPSPSSYHRYLIDHRTDTVVEQFIPQNEVSWQRTIDGFKETKTTKARLLPKPLLLKLSYQVQMLKRHFFADQKVTWSVNKNELVIEHIEPYPIDSTAGNPYKVVALGTRLIAGYVQAKVRSLSSPHAKMVLPSGTILVAETLTKQNLPDLKICNGVIVEKMIKDQQVLEFLHHYAIPTIVSTFAATKLLLPAMEITLDATNGRVYVLHETSQEVLPNHSTSNRYLLTSFLSSLSRDHRKGAVGALIQSDPWFTSVGSHPLHLTKHQRQTLQSSIFTETTIAQQTFPNKWMYQLMSLNSHERQQLNLGQGEEMTEPNPALGSRGTNYLLAHSNLLSLELEPLQFLQQQPNYSSPTIHLVFPFCNTVHDGAFMETIIHQKFPNFNFKPWLHLTNLAGITQLLTARTWIPHGVIIDLDYLVSSWQGTDPQQPQLSFTSIVDSQLWPLLEQLLSKLHLPIRLLCRNLPPNLVATLDKLPSEVIITHLNHLVVH